MPGSSAFCFGQSAARHRVCAACCPSKHALAK
jgi:hypothetical protein